MVWDLVVFEVVAVTAGRYPGRPGGRRRCRWCGAWWCSLMWALPVVEVWVVVPTCSWSFLVSMVLAFRVFDDVGVTTGR